MTFPTAEPGPVTSSPHPALAWLSKHQTLSATLILVFVLHVCFFPFIWGNKTLLAASRGIPSIMPNGAWYGQGEGPTLPRGNDPGASAWTLEPWAALIHHQYFSENKTPLWNPYQSYGTPLAANMQSQPFNPLFILFALHPGPRTYNLFILCRFLVAGLCAYLYLRLFLPFAASLAGGIACMLSGYYILFFNMPELSVSTLVAAVFLVTERLLREQSVRNVVSSIAVIFLSIVGGMPESTLLVLAFGYVYFVFRLLSDSGMRAAAGRRLRYYLFVNVLGFALAAILLAPFLEFMSISFDTHQPANIHGDIYGLRHDRFGLSIFTYVVPGLFGPTWAPIAPGLGGYDALRGFIGIIQLLFVILAIAGLSGKRERRFPCERALTVFFLVSSIAILLKRYGAPVINWIGYLPFCQFVWFPKYEEPLLAFALSVLCAFGMAQVFTQSAPRRRLVACLVIAFLVLAAALAFSLPAVLTAKAQVHAYNLSLGGACALLSLVTLVLLGLGGSGPNARTTKWWLPGALLALLVTEMAGNYIYPVYYRLARSATDDANPYRGAPYIDYLKSRLAAGERIFGRNGILHPEWAGSFRMADIRGLDAMYFRKYMTFVRYFLRDDPRAPRGDLVNRFNGLNWLAFDSPLKRRLLQLSSAKYLLSTEPYGSDAALVRDIVRQNVGRLTPGRENLIVIRTFTIGGETKAVLFEHPPYERLPFKTQITPERQRLFFSIAMDPAVYDGSHPICGDGVEFRLEIRDSRGRVEPLYSRYIDPKQNPAERRWTSESVDLSKYLDQIVELLFTTTPGPAGNSCMDWAGWGDPHFSSDAGAEPAFALVYDHEVRIYEYRDVLPRAALFSGVELAADEEAALARLAAPSLDIFRTAVVSATGLSAANIEALKEIGRLPAEPARAGTILSYASQEVKIDAASERPGLLVLNDSNYPGWKVYVDGRPSKWITADYLFRGVLLKPGRHIVRFAYEPASFVAGAAIAGAGLLCLAGFIVWRRTSKPSCPTTRDLSETHG